MLKNSLTNKLIIVSGPTATGKTKIAIDIAKMFKLEVINFDSLLFYKQLNIGTAKPTEQEKSGVIHHMINIRDITMPLNAADYMRLCLPLIEKIQNSQRPPILVGGSGFYLQAVLRGMYESITPSNEILEKSDQLFKTDGITPFREILKENDPINYKKLHENDHYRIRRAVEHFWMTGKAFSKVKEDHEKLIDGDNIRGWNCHHIHLDMEKPKHWEIIEKRTDTMLKHGLIEEVKSILDQGYDKDLRPLKSIGYKQSIDYLNGRIKNIEECRDKIIFATRQLSKAQRTWFSHEEHKTTYSPLQDHKIILDDVSQFLSI